MALVDDGKLLGMHAIPARTRQMFVNPLGHGWFSPSKYVVVVRMRRQFESFLQLWAASDTPIPVSVSGLKLSAVQEEVQNSHALYRGVVPTLAPPLTVNTRAHSSTHTCRFLVTASRQAWTGSHRPSIASARTKRTRT